MAGELTAVRVLAPHFGDSASVWTNVIGVILAALAGGAWCGGRLAAREGASKLPTRLMIIAGLMFGIVPFAARPLGGWLLPAELPLDAAMPAIVRGSFVATAVLFGLPMFLLGTLAPLLVAGLAKAGVPVGRAAGGISAAGTLGSLAGTFAATHWLVPEYGCRIAMSIAGALLVLAGLLVAARQAARVTAALALATVSLAVTGHGGPLRSPRPGRELLAEVESRHQFLQVQREHTNGAPARTLLVINEGLDSFHSLAVEGSAFTGGAYYDWHAVVPLFVEPGRRPAGLRAVSIGDAAGSLRAIYHAVHPGATVDAVDIDAECMALGDRFFAAPKAGGTRSVLDGRVFLERARQQWHVIHVDAYAHQVYVPAHLASREFFAAARERLLPGGVVACNVGALHPEDPVLRAIGNTLAAVFGNAMALHVPNSRNFLLVGRNGSAIEPRALAGFSFGEERLPEADAAHWRHLVATAATPKFWSSIDGGGVVLEDDRPVLDRLLLASYVDRADTGALVECRGSQDAAGAEMTAYAAGLARNWSDVLTAVASSRNETASLRELAGDARWSLRQLRSARAEYQSAVAATSDPAVSERLRGKQASLAQDLAPITRAEEVAERNGRLQFWLCLLVLVLGLACLMRN
jgi:spermidine synthase